MTSQNTIEQIIHDFIENSPENSLKMETEEPAWEETLIGYSSGADPVYDSFKEHVGEFHYTPAEIFNLTFPDSPAKPEELTVISWILLQRESTKKDNRAEDFYPAARWVMARFPGEAFNELLRTQVVEELAGLGVDAVTPTLSPHWNMEMSPKFSFASRWSERHAAYASGLGTFGLCDGLITARGKAHRAGSVVARLKLEATPRPYDDHRAYCLFFTKEKCMACAKRCPVDAITEKGHDKQICWDHAGGTCGKYVKEKFGFDGYGCGLCQTKVPCEHGIPKSLDAG
ncbi:MAG: epoxyqueuosine reductase [Proteobacteria bacterium]|nr:epoxyqueuosine reductase [Pseudomonadota bacterium]